MTRARRRTKAVVVAVVVVVVVVVVERGQCKDNSAAFNCVCESRWCGVVQDRPFKKRKRLKIERERRDR
jgi:hypothetical protein